MTTVEIATALRSPERVLHSIAASARIEGMAAPRRISFDEPRPGEPLAVLSLTWTSLADMRPWLPYFAADKVHPYRRADGSAHHTAYAEFGGWQVSLNAVDSARCDCKGDVTHMIGCAAMSYPADPVITGTPAEVLAHLADHYGRDVNRDEAVRLDRLRRGEAPRYSITAAYDLAREEDDLRTRARKVERTWRGEITPDRLAADHDEAVRLGAEHHTLTIADVVTDLARPCPNGCSRNLLALQPPDGLVYCDGCGYTEPAPVAFSDAQRVQAETWRAAVTQ